ncbi:MAG TPA: SUMF1/EgtB/PvdO family nonheme iron enzyme [Rhizomicrobium sp.]|nr:SUMF1/EgtB/PvdO family nonheme iron enzyme [Rhizomicrobium sp.]
MKRFTRSCSFAALMTGSALSSVALAQDSSYRPNGQQIPPPACYTQMESFEDLRAGPAPAPCSAQSHQDWLKDVQHWRSERHIRTGYDDARYRNPALAWAQSSFIQPQMMVQDRYLYDPVVHKYTVDRYLDDLEKRYGGIDSVLVWPTYPNMGIDDRNQQDMVRSMPGGVEGVKAMVADFHRRGVRVMFPMMMWDQGTRDPGKSWPDAEAELMKELNADGINGDTQEGVPLAFSLAAEKIGHPLAFEPELTMDDEALSWDVLHWGEYRYQFVPTLDKYRWQEPRHQVHIQGRWDHDKTNALQFAFFNGEGWESWENVWGIWNGVTPRDGEATRRVATLERALTPFFASKDWEPFYPMQAYGVFASRWPLNGQTLWTLVNRNSYDLDRPQLLVPFTDGMRYFDLYHGLELQARRDGGNAVLSFPLEGHGFGAVLAVPGNADAKIADLMTKMKAMTAKPLASYSAEWKPLPQQLIEIKATQPATSAPDGMIKIAGGDYDFKVEGIEIEGHNDTGVDVQYPWENAARRFHEHRMSVKPFLIDKYPVTNADFKKFLDATHYRPADALNFLKDWKDGTYPQGWDKKPVTWVSQEDARAYAQWAGKRLPHEWEWQMASEGPNRRVYPWGDTWDASAVPVPGHARTLNPPDDVDAHPKGASEAGVMDLVGNVWQMTDEYVDDHTRAAILRGGNHYQPSGSIWYFPQAYRNDQHGKLLLMAPAYDRSGTVGFRCVKDAG